MHFDNINNNNGSEKNNHIEDLSELQKQLEILKVSDTALNMIIISLILSSMNINKSKVEILDKINGTKNAEKLQDSRQIEKLSNELSLLGSGIFFYLAENKLSSTKKELNKSNNELEVKKNFEGASKNHTVSLLYFLAAIIDCC